MRFGLLLLAFFAFISIFYIVGVALLGYGLWLLKRSYDVSHWPSTNGSVISCDLVRDSSRDSETHEVKVQYRYRVAGQEYTGETLAIGYGASSGRTAHHEIFTRLKEADSVRVLYDPYEPQSAVLSHGIHRSVVLMLVFAVTWNAFIVGITVLLWLASSSDTVLLQNLVTNVGQP